MNYNELMSRLIMKIFRKCTKKMFEVPLIVKKHNIKLTKKTKIANNGSKRCQIQVGIKK